MFFDKEIRARVTLGCELKKDAVVEVSVVAYKN